MMFLLVCNAVALMEDHQSFFQMRLKWLTSQCSYCTVKGRGLSGGKIFGGRRLSLLGAFAVPVAPVPVPVVWDWHCANQLEGALWALGLGKVLCGRRVLDPAPARSSIALGRLHAE